MKRRVQRLEDMHGASGPALGLIVISIVAPSADGPVHLGPYAAHILTGNNAGTEVMRADDESVEAFRLRCDGLLRSAP